LKKVHERGAAEPSMNTNVVGEERRTRTPIRRRWRAEADEDPEGDFHRMCTRAWRESKRSARTEASPRDRIPIEEDRAEYHKTRVRQKVHWFGYLTIPIHDFQNLGIIDRFHPKWITIEMEGKLWANRFSSSNMKRLNEILRTNEFKRLKIIWIARNARANEMIKGIFIHEPQRWMHQDLREYFRIELMKVWIFKQSEAMWSCTCNFGWLKKVMFTHNFNYVNKILESEFLFPSRPNRFAEFFIPQLFANLHSHALVGIMKIQL
jgi:hypothetical protein